LPKHVATLNEYNSDCAKQLYYTNNNNNNTLTLFTKHNKTAKFNLANTRGFLNR